MAYLGKYYAHKIGFPLTTGTAGEHSKGSAVS